MIKPVYLNAGLTDSPGRVTLKLTGEYSPRWPETLAMIRSADATSRTIPPFAIDMSWAAYLATWKRLRKLASKIDVTPELRAVMERDITTQPVLLTGSAAAESLAESGFRGRTLTVQQDRDLRLLCGLKHGANFSVPGAGKTTVTLALHQLWAKNLTTPALLVVAPKSAFTAWEETLAVCVEGVESFTRVTAATAQADLARNPRYAIVSYEGLSAGVADVAAWMSQRSVHLVLDESHRIKSATSARGLAATQLSHLATRRDILSGTPAPQGTEDLVNQVLFLHPGESVLNPGSPLEVLGNCFARTTKQELGLPPRLTRTELVVPYRGELLLYGVLREDLKRSLAGLNMRDSKKVRDIGRQVVTLIRSTVDSVLVLEKLPERPELPYMREVHEELTAEHFVPSKLAKAAYLARTRAREGLKTVVWSSFPRTIEAFATMCADLSPVFVHGGVSTRDESGPDSREGRIRRFHRDPECFLFVGNPAACGEGISLHEASQCAVYLDRLYNAAHYMQSIDRVHRLGLKPEQTAEVVLIRWELPDDLGSIDNAVDRRLAVKIENLGRLLDDPDLFALANNHVDWPDDDAPPANEQDENPGTTLDDNDLDDLSQEFGQRRS